MDEWKMSTIMLKYKYIQRNESDFLRSGKMYFVIPKMLKQENSLVSKI